MSGLVHSLCIDACPSRIIITSEIESWSVFLLCRFGICPHLTQENKDSLRKRDLLTAYYDLDYLRNPKGSNYWRNRWLGFPAATIHLRHLRSVIFSVPFTFRVLKMGSKFSSRGLLFSVANRIDFIEELEDEFGLGTSDGTDLPFVTIRTRTGQKYTMREEFTWADISF